MTRKTIKRNSHEKVTVDKKQMNEQKQLQTENINDDVKTTYPTDELEAAEKITRRRGRPKTKKEDDRQVNIRVPVSILEQWEIIKPVYGGNLTKYINKLIEKDLKDNYEKYIEIMEMLKE